MTRHARRPVPPGEAQTRQTTHAYVLDPTVPGYCCRCNLPAGHVSHTLLPTADDVVEGEQRRLGERQD